MVCGMETMAMGSIWRNADRNASCRGGVFATRRFPRLPPPPSAPIGAYRPGPRQRPFIRHGLVREDTRGGRATFGPPLQHRPYQDPHATRRCPHKRCAALNRDAARHVATNAPPPPHHPPTCALPSSYLGRCTLGFWHEIRGCSGPGRAMVGRRYGGIRGNGRGHTGLHGLRIWWGSAFVATRRATSRLIISASPFRSPLRFSACPDK